MILHNFHMLLLVIAHDKTVHIMMDIQHHLCQDELTLFFPILVPDSLVKFHAFQLARKFPVNRIICPLPFKPHH